MVSIAPVIVANVYQVLAVSQTVCKMPYMIISFNLHSSEVGLIVPCLQMKKQMHREVKKSVNVSQL